MSTTPAYYQTPGHNIAAGVAFSVLDIVFVGLRFWTRRKQSQPFRVDDWLLLPATLLTIAISILAIYGISQKSIAYPMQLPPDPMQLGIAAVVEYGTTLALPLNLGFVKLSFLFFYYRIFAVERKSAINWTLIAMMIIVAMWTAAFFFTILFECGVNFNAIWGPRTKATQSQCVEIMPMVLAFCLSDFVTDLIIIGIPVPLIWRLKLSAGKKMAASSVFLLGGVTIAASLVRLVVYIQAITRGNDHHSDMILTITICIYWGIVECGVGVFAACLPTLSFLFKPLSWDFIRSKTRSIFSTERTMSSSRVAGTGQSQTAGNSGLRSKLRGAQGGYNTDDEVLLDNVESRGSNKPHGGY